jgi:hypothetical protein
MLHESTKKKGLYGAILIIILVSFLKNIFNLKKIAIAEASLALPARFCLK